MRRIILLTLAAALVGGQAPAQLPAAPAAPTEGTYREVVVVDGDTVILPTTAGFVTGIKLRLLGIDAPELRGACPTERAMALAATNRLRELVARRVRVVSYLEADAYGRFLGRLYDREGRDVGAVLLAEGLVRPLAARQARSPWCGAP